MKQSLTIKDMKRAIETPTVKKLVASWLLAKTHAEIMREKVDNVYREILEEIPLYDDKDFGSERTRGSGDRITDQKHFYLSSDESSVQKCWDEADKRLRDIGLKPESMPAEYCPALVSEHEVLKIEWLLLETTATPIGISWKSLYGEKREKWLNLVVGAIVILPDFTNPLETL